MAIDIAGKSDSEIVAELRRIYGVETDREVLEKALEIALRASKWADANESGSGGGGLFTPSGAKIRAIDPVTGDDT